MYRGPLLHARGLPSAEMTALPIVQLAISAMLSCRRGERVRARAHMLTALSVAANRGLLGSAFDVIVLRMPFTSLISIACFIVLDQVGCWRALLLL